MYSSPNRSQGSPGQSSGASDRILANMFRDLATQESLVSEFAASPHPQQSITLVGDYMTTNAFGLD